MEFGTTPGFWIVRKRKRKQRAREGTAARDPEFFSFHVAASSKDHRIAFLRRLGVDDPGVNSPTELINALPENESIRTRESVSVDHIPPALITQRKCVRPSPAMFLETVKDFNLTLVANVSGSLQRIDRIRSVEPKDSYPAWRRIRRVIVKYGLPSPETDARGEDLT